MVAGYRRGLLWIDLVFFGHCPGEFDKLEGGIRLGGQLLSRGIPRMLCVDIVAVVQDKVTENGKGFGKEGRWKCVGGVGKRNIALMASENTEMDSLAGQNIALMTSDNTEIFFCPGRLYGLLEGAGHFCSIFSIAI